jgi:hypothetical protein
MLKNIRTAALVAGLLSMSSAFAGWQTDFPAGGKSDEKADKPEDAVVLPAPPKSENLITFYTRSSQSFAIDKASLIITSDDIVRYTLVATSSSGVKNISYEGIRCASFARKIYAFGRPDGSWSASRRDEWDAISNNPFTLQYTTLANEYFCDGPALSGKVDSIVRRFTQHQPSKLGGAY